MAFHTDALNVDNVEILLTKQKKTTWRFPHGFLSAHGLHYLESNSCRLGQFSINFPLKRASTYENFILCGFRSYFQVVHINNNIAKIICTEVTTQSTHPSETRFKATKQNKKFKC